MKHLRLYETQKDYLDDIFTDMTTEYPIVACAENDEDVDFFNIPIVKGKVEINESQTLGDTLTPLQSHLSIKKLIVDGEKMWEKDMWLKMEYEVSPNDFTVEENEREILGEIRFAKYDLFDELTMSGKNILLKGENPTHLMVATPLGGSYATIHIVWTMYNFEEYKDEFHVKQIDDNTYDVSDFYSYVAPPSPSPLLILLANETEVIPQTVTYERLGVVEEIEVSSVEVTKDNVFTNLVHQGFVASIHGEIDPQDVVGLIASMDGELMGVMQLPISALVEVGIGSVGVNKVDFNISILSGELGGITISYCLLDKSIGNVNDMNGYDILPYVKDATVKWSSFSYNPPLSLGTHEVEMELISYKSVSSLNKNVVTEIDLSSLYGPFVETLSIFEGAKKLTKVILPEKLTTIGDDAFSGCESLTSITIPDSVTSIGSYAFRNCSGLTSVTIGSGVRSISDYAFQHCSGLTEIVIPDSVTSIGVQVFDGCHSLTSITIPNSVTTIGNGAFMACAGLTEITIPNSVTSIGDGAFRNCSGLTEIVIPDSVTSIGVQVFDGCHSLTSITIPNSVTTIGDGAFRNCSGLTSVTIGSGVTTIGESAFMACAGLTEITIPNSVTSIGDGAFRNCSGLTSVTIGSGVRSIGNSTFKGCTSLTSITIPNSVTSIGNSTFNGCESLTSITIPNSVTTIGDDAFSGCTFQRDKFINLSSASDYPWGAAIYDIVQDDGLCINGTTVVGCQSNATSVIIPDSVREIGEDAFYACTSLTSVTIGSGVREIGDSAFYKCRSLTSVTIGSGVTVIFNYVFKGCTSLTEIVCYATKAPIIGGYNFDGMPKNGVLKVPSGSDYSSWVSALPSGWTIEYM